MLSSIITLRKMCKISSLVKWPNGKKMKTVALRHHLLVLVIWYDTSHDLVYTDFDSEMNCMMYHTCDISMEIDTYPLLICSLWKDAHREICYTSLKVKFVQKEIIKITYFTIFVPHKKRDANEFIVIDTNIRT